MRPDILILDEVLSVGDGAFRKKSEAKMKEVIRGGATTILVSHSLAQHVQQGVVAGSRSPGGFWQRCEGTVRSVSTVFRR